MSARNSQQTLMVNGKPYCLSTSVPSLSRLRNFLDSQFEVFEKIAGWAFVLWREL